MRPDMTSSSLIQDIDAFLAETGMGPSYFGKRAARNSEIVARLRAGRRVWPETENQIRAFIETERRRRNATPHTKELQDATLLVARPA